MNVRGLRTILSVVVGVLVAHFALRAETAVVPVAVAVEPQQRVPEAAAPGLPQAVADPQVRRRGPVDVVFGTLPSPATAAGRPGVDRLRLDLFPDVSIVAVFDRYEPNATGTTWVGRVEGVDGSSVTMVYGRGELTASIATPDASYRIHPSAAGHVVVDVDQDAVPPEAPPIEVAPPPGAAGFAVAADPHGDPPQYVDLMVVYTPAAVSYAGSVNAVQQLIAVGVTETNTAYANSGINHQLRLVHTAQVAHTESGDISSDLSSLRTGAGAFSGVSALRDAYGADLVMLVQRTTASSYCGVAYVMSSPGSFFASWAFSVVEANCISPNYSFAHELGHNMGSRHDWYVDDSVTPATWAHGHVSTASGNRWRTIMSYSNLCTALGFSCSRVLNFSSPTVSIGGAPTGVAGGTNASCVEDNTANPPCDADNRRVHNDAAPITAAFKSPPLPSAFSKVAPTTGATGVSSPATLSWQSTTGATSYEYCLDTSNDSACAGPWTSTGTGLSVGTGALAASTTYYWQARAVNETGSTQANSGTWWSFTTAGPPPNLVQNGTFGSGLTGWQLYATPDASYIVSNVSGGVLEFYRRPPPAGTSNQAVVFQQTGAALGADAPIVLSAAIGNSSAVWKRISLLAHDADFSDLHVCTFWLPPNAPLQTYVIRTHTTEAWTDATVSFYAASVNAAGDVGSYRLDAVSLAQDPAGSAGETRCEDPNAPAPPGGADGPELVTNGAFTSGLTGWSLFGQIVQQVAGGVFEFYRPAGDPAGVVFQPIGQAMGAGEILTGSLALGNSSGVRKRVTVILHDLDFSDLAACTFWLDPGQALSTYTVRTFATRAWANATLSVYPSTVGTSTWIRLDNVSLRRTPSASIVGTLCDEPG